ncbi:MAG: hypothetical protein AWU54_2056 [Candidatus Frackibacter sp. T328-2]|nr:MAG: hypothetical protein AWU54_2056 [Candidatus Frackibacter sp. T328-2]
MNQEQKDLIESLHRNLIEINEEAINDDEFYEWLNNNYFFNENLEEVIARVNKAKKNL